MECPRVASLRAKLMAAEQREQDALAKLKALNVKTWKANACNC